MWRELHIKHDRVLLLLLLFLFCDVERAAREMSDYPRRDGQSEDGSRKASGSSSPSASGKDGGKLSLRRESSGDKRATVIVPQPPAATGGSLRLCATHHPDHALRTPHHTHHTSP
jgi:hypothetical protein